MRRSRGLVAALAVATVACVATIARAPVGVADDTAWKARIDKSLADVEKGVAELDAKSAAPGDLPARIAALHARLVALEATHGLTAGTISGQADLTSSTLDVGALTTRWKAVAAAKAGVPPKPPAPPPAPASAPVKPSTPKSAVPDWPETIAFSIGAKIGWDETGAFRSVEVQRDVWENRFFADGFQATLSFNLAARGLVRDVKAVELLVAVRLAGPLTARSGLWRTYKVSWEGERGLGNDSLRRFLNHDKFWVPQPVTMRMSGRKGSYVPEAFAHVVSATLLDGTVKTFDVPTYRTD